jgi:hypothetical protein
MLTSGNHSFASAGQRGECRETPYFS